MLTAGRMQKFLLGVPLVGQWPPLVCYVSSEGGLKFPCYKLLQSDPDTEICPKFGVFSGYVGAAVGTVGQLYTELVGLDFHIEGAQRSPRLGAKFVPAQGLNSCWHGESRLGCGRGPGLTVHVSGFRARGMALWRMCDDAQNWMGKGAVTGRC